MRIENDNEFFLNFSFEKLYKAIEEKYVFFSEQQKTNAFIVGFASFFFFGMGGGYN